MGDENFTNVVIKSELILKVTPNDATDIKTEFEDIQEQGSKSLFQQEDNTNTSFTTGSRNNWGNVLKDCESEEEEKGQEEVAEEQDGHCAHDIGCKCTIKCCVLLKRIDSNFRSLSCTFVGDPQPTHIRKTSFKCAFCEKSFSRDSNLVRHARSHTGVKPYKCKFCEKSFPQNSHLISHKRTHTGEKPFKCKFCGKSFPQNSHLISHKRTHTGEKPYKCKFCEKSFTQNGHLINHKRTHTGEKPYKCKFCKKGFSVSCSLVTHERRHTGKKPYKCKLCERSFTQLSHLVTHERRHTGEKPYKCNGREILQM